MTPERSQEAVEAAARESYESRTGLPWDIEDAPGESLAEKQDRERKHVASILAAADAADPSVPVPVREIERMQRGVLSLRGLLTTPTGVYALDAQTQAIEFERRIKQAAEICSRLATVLDEYTTERADT